MTRKAEILEELKTIEARSAELEQGVETAEAAELEARTKEAEELATRQKALREELQKIEAEEQAAEEVRNNPSIATPITTPINLVEPLEADAVKQNFAASVYPVFPPSIPSNVFINLFVFTSPVFLPLG